jgi:PKD repeat protein
MKRLSTFFNLILIFTIAFTAINLAQKPVEHNQLQILPDETEQSETMNSMRINSKTEVPIALYKVNYNVNPDTPERMARQYLLENSVLLKLESDLSDLRYLTTKETRAAYHVHYAQYIGEYPVYNSTLNITIDLNNNVLFVMNGYKLAYGVKVEPDLQTIVINANSALLEAKNYLGIQGTTAYENTETVIYYNQGKFRLAQKVNIVPSEELFGDWEVLVDAQTGEIFRAEDKACYLHNGGDDPDLVDGSGWVFDPDPITHARTTYGTPGFVDNNDADSDSLTAHLEQRTLFDIDFNGSVYTLKGPWAEIRDFESPFTGLHTNPTSDFHFTRSDDNFEAANTYFHIDNSMRWINDSLSIPLTPYQYTGGVRFDPHGLNGADNSHYLSSTGSVAFGDGGVDDAEDLGVVLHELGHGLHDWLTVGGISQNEGLSEGCGDYWCTSYIRSTGYWTPGDPAYNWVFIWDGHNPFWSGRIVNYTAHYPEGLVGQIHTDGQMWASSLMSIYDLIGRIPTDSDFLEGLAMTNGSSNQPDAANAFIAADQLNYGGANLVHIIPVFADRGYIEGPITADFTADVTSGQAPLTVQFTDLSISQPNPIVSWEWDFDNNGSIDATTQNPSWEYLSFGIYTVTLTVSDGTNQDSETKIDYITVTDPNQVTDTVFTDLFEDGIGLWTIINNGGTCDWQIFTPPYPNAYTLPATSSGGVLAADSDECGSGTTMNTTAEVIQVLDLTNYDVVTIEFDNDWRTIDAADEAHVEVSNDGGSTWTGVWDQVGTDVRNTHETVNISSMAANQSNVKVRLRSVQPGWDWWWAVDNFHVFGSYIIPVELTSFSAALIDNKVILNWETATETNNMGFEIERKSGPAEFTKIGFVEGHSTTTEKQNYQFIDQMNDLKANSLTYRLKQIDYDGSYEYSQEVFVDNPTPMEFALRQNYPNPYNPVTTITYSLPIKAKVELIIYNALGESIKQLVNEEKEAGKYSVKFDATNLPSGIYFYKLQAGSFVETKKMVLMK